MGRTVYWMNVSLDLRIEGAAGEDGGGSWMRIDEVLHAEFNARARGITLDVSGRHIYEIMESYWPAVREDDSEPDVIREYGHIWTDTPKVLVSNTRTEAQHDTRIVGGDDAMEQLRGIIAETEGLVGVGGANLATQFLRHGMLDEVWLFTHPVVLGGGRPLFDDPQQQVELDLLEQATYGEGITFHRYAVRR